MNQYDNCRRINMKKYILIVIITGLAIFSCTLKNPTQPEIEGVSQGDLVLTKMVAIGNSITAGFQSAGLVKEFQLNSYPYIMADMMGVADGFEMPLIKEPGIGQTIGFGPLKIENGQIVGGDPIPGGIAGIPLLLENALLPRPYDNLGVPGSKVIDILNATSALTSSSSNPFFDLILRNPNFGNTTQLEQLILLNPTLVLLWVGSNDVLGAAVNGTVNPGVLPTPQTDFENGMTQIVEDIQSKTNAKIVIANIPDVTVIPYVNILDGLVYKDFPGIGTLPVVFDESFHPVDFDTSASGELYIPLLTEEGLLSGGSPVEHLLLPFLSEYKTNGLGVPDSAALVPLLITFGIPPGQAPARAKALEQGMIANGLTPSGVQISDSLTLTEDETTSIQDAITGYNDFIEQTLAPNKGLVLVDIKTKLNEIRAASLTGGNVDGVTSFFVLIDPARTAFSLDGVHPSNAGQAIIAKEFVIAINTAFGLTTPIPIPSDYTGQYLGSGNILKISSRAMKQMRRMFIYN
jgi:lysophospholipase L1-like esterase